MKNLVQYILLSHIFIALVYGYVENLNSFVALSICLTVICVFIEVLDNQSPCVDESRCVKSFNVENQLFSDDWKWEIKQKVSTFIYRRYKCNTAFANECDQVKKGKVLSKSKHLNSDYYHPRSSIPDKRRRAIKESVASLSQS